MATSRIETLEKLKNLEIQRAQIKKDKKIASKDYGDQIKDVEKDIEEVLEELKNLVE